MKNHFIQRASQIIFHDRDIIPYSLGVLLENMLKTASPVLMGYFIDAIIHHGAIWRISSAMVGSALLVILLHRGLRTMICRISRDTELELQQTLLSKFCAMRPLAVDNYRQGEVALKFFRDVANVGLMIRELFPRLLYGVFNIALTIAVVVWKNYIMAIAALAFVPLVVWRLRPYQQQFERIQKNIRRMYDLSMNRIFEFMHIFPYLKAMDADAAFSAEPVRKFHRFNQLFRKDDCNNTSFEFADRVILFIGEYAVVIIAGYLAWRNRISVGDVVVFQCLFLSVLNATTEFFKIFPQWAQIRESIISVDELLLTEQTENIQSGVILPSFCCDITVKNVTFFYPKVKIPALHGVNCHITAGTVVAITGANGRGKTTFLKLISNYMPCDKGEIWFGEVEVHDICKSYMRKKIAFVFQDALLITGNIRDNITLKNLKYTEREISEALRLSGADSVVSRLPDGLSHRIGFDGGGLSGGERQKIAIARAIIRRPDILILDEVTNHLDYESRIKMRFMIAAMRGKCTIFMVSHDPELVGLCDQQINLDDI